MSLHNVIRSIDKLFARNADINELRAIAQHARNYVNVLADAHTAMLADALRDTGNMPLPSVSTLEAAADLRQWFLEDLDAHEFVATYCPEVEVALVDWWELAQSFQSAA